MTLFSSQSRRTINRDGSWNVYCHLCKRFIAVTHIQMGKTVCELCTRVENGEMLTDEMVRAYEAGHLDRSEISFFNVPLEPEPIKALGSRLRNMGVGALQALGIKKEPAVKAVKSKAIAQERQRKRVFDMPDALGSMDEIDAALNRGKERQ